MIIYDIKQRNEEIYGNCKRNKELYYMNRQTNKIITCI